MRILGVDPGTLITGYGVVDYNNGAFALVDYGVIRTAPAMSLPIRLEKIYSGLVEVIARTLPDEFAIESAFYSKNVQSTLKLGHARGVAILSAVLKQIPTSEYAPREVKRAVTGSGNASKESVEYMIMTMLKIAERHQFLDATDALSVAVCHALRRTPPKSIQSGSSRSKRSKSWSAFVTDNPDRIRKLPTSGKGGSKP